MIFKTVCAWSGVFISVINCPASKHCQESAINGKIISHGMCKDCKTIEIEKYKLNRRKRHGLV